MRLCFVVQRYGAEVAGGAEALCGQFAERLAARGHTVSVLTTCARDYDTWEDFYDPGTSDLNGVRVERLAVSAPREPARLRTPPRGRRTRCTERRAEPCAVRRLDARTGAEPRGFADRLRQVAAEVDVVVFFTYLYATTSIGVAAVSGLVPTLLHPTAHEEWPLRLP
ncbi:MAG: hypothetical protein R2698_01930 [Microthrixaceae bacterium]